ncbi:MAG: hypothetical protein ACREQ5_00615 [Candidatus Dormibacteria bacterium]
MKRPEDITATITLPANQFGSDWNWAEEATTAWLAEAAKHNVSIEEVDTDLDEDSVAAKIQHNGIWYDLEVGRTGNSNEVRAVEAAEYED